MRELLEIVKPKALGERGLCGPKRGMGRGTGIPRNRAWSPVEGFARAGWYVGTLGM